MEAAKQLVWVGRGAAAIYLIANVVPFILVSSMLPAWELMFSLRSVCLLTALMMLGMVVSMTPRENGSQVNQTIAALLIADAVVSLVLGQVLFNWEQFDALSMYYRIKVGTFILCKSLVAVGFIRSWKIARWGLAVVLLIHLGNVFPILNSDTYFAPFHILPQKTAVSGSPSEVVVVHTSSIGNLGNGISTAIFGLMVFYSFALRGRRSLGDRFGLGAQSAS